MVVGPTIIATLSVLIVVSALISATEAAVLAVNKVRLRHKVEQGDRRAKLTYQLLTRLDRVIGTLLVANNLANVAISAIGTWICLSIFGPKWGIAIATVVVSAIVLLACEVAPKMFAMTRPQAVIFAMVWPLMALMAVLNPISIFFVASARALLKLLRIPIKRRSPLVTEEEIKVMIRMGREAGVLAEQELRMLHRIFEFSDAFVRQVMIPREEIAGIDLHAKPDEAIDVLIEEGHSRIPVYRGSIDQVVGMIYARDVLTMFRHGELFILSDLIRPIASVSGNKRIAELLSEFQRDKTQIAIVHDGKQKTIGIVTIEDLLEEIVGEIEEAPTRRT